MTFSLPARSAAALALVYFLLALLSITLATRAGYVAFIWPPVAVLLGVLLRSTPARWPLFLGACFVADVAANLLLGGTLPATLGLAAGSLAEVLPGAWLLQRHFGRPFRLTTLPAALGFLLVACLTPLPGALLGATVLHAALGAPWLEALRIWWASTALAMIIVAPVLLTWTPAAGAVFRRRHAALEAAGLVLLLLATTTFVFTRPFTPLLFLLLPLLIWGALRFGPAGHSLTALLLTTAALAWTYAGHGPIAATGAAPALQAHLLQLFLTSIAAPSLLVAVIVTALRRSAVERERLIHTLESQKAELERFAYTISHELKTPLVTITGFAGLIRDDLARADTVRAEDDLSIIEQAARTMQQSLDHLLELTRLGRPIGAPRRVRLRDLVDDALATVAARIEQKGATILVADDLPTVRGDPQRLREVLTILLDNALKFTKPSEAPRIEIGARPANPHPVCFVKDNGTGIEPVYHERVFDLFERLEATHEGAGAGLALARRIVEAHGGRIWIESAGRGRGTTVCFSLPLESSGK
ncbi:MASE1 domain-containing protein [Rhodocaloribacter litoris]|uniref:sensor histidine kinase n=1 Tax=Rhodocaloribacter litoris TaxID=2558931 RepID=UPI0014234172|nr:MASE1 domain-containing protein [Rhodocaloribacter litoris]QXD16873.1 MASE1 domain-containing protein [Rhodocaloribacter litoris]